MPVRTNGFQDRLVMTASIPLRIAHSHEVSHACKKYISRMRYSCQHRFLLFSQSFSQSFSGFLMDRFFIPKRSSPCLQANGRHPPFLLIQGMPAVCIPPLRLRPPWPWPPVPGAGRRLCPVSPRAVRYPGGRNDHKRLSVCRWAGADPACG